MLRVSRYRFIGLSAILVAAAFHAGPVFAQARSTVGNQQQGQGGRLGGASAGAAGGTSLLDSVGGQEFGAFTQQSGGGNVGGAGAAGGFVGRGATNNGFVGRGNAGGQTQQSQQRNNLSQFGRNRGAAGGNNRGGGNRGAGSRRTIRPRLRIAFQYPKLAVAEVTASLTGRFERVASRRPGLTGVRLQAGAEGEVTLRGAVDSAETRKLAEIMARMQPGVRKVKNELSIEQGAGQP